MKHRDGMVLQTFGTVFRRDCSSSVTQEDGAERVCPLYLQGSAQETREELHVTSAERGCMVNPSRAVLWGIPRDFGLSCLFLKAVPLRATVGRRRQSGSCLEWQPSWTAMARIKKVPTAGFLEVVFFMFHFPFIKGCFLAVQ